MMQLQLFAAVSKDSAHIGGKAKVAMAGGGVKYVDTHPRRRIEIKCFDTLSPDVERSGMVKGAACGVQYIKPEGWGNCEVARRYTLPHYGKHFVEFLDITENVDYHILKPRLNADSFFADKIEQIQRQLYLPVSQKSGYEIMPAII